jgi:hypothetical protein
MSTIGNTPRPAPLARPPRTTRRRLAWSVVLVLAAFGGAGLATAADRLPTGGARPELTWHADQQLAPRLAAMTTQLLAIDADLDELAGAGRDALSLLPALVPADIEAAVARGDAASARLADGLGPLSAMRAEQLALVEDSRVSQANQRLLAGIDAAIAAADGLPGEWSEMANAARRVTLLLASLLGHDELVFAATDAGRRADWSGALALLEQAAQPLAQAGLLRDALAVEGDVSTLDELLRRYADYDAALTNLYAEILRGGTQDSPALTALRAEVERTQALLPGNNDALRVVVSEAAGPSVASGLVVIEEARGAVGDALVELGVDGR